MMESFAQIEATSSICGGSNGGRVNSSAYIADMNRERQVCYVDK